MGRPIPSELISQESERKEVILGMPGPWAEESLEPSDHYTTKVGGLPDWPMRADEIYSDLLKCGLCGGELGLVAQVYAPLKVRGTEIEERTLYIFGCPSSTCGISPLSWRTLRVQSTAPSQNRASSSTEASTSARNTSTLNATGNASRTNQAQAQAQRNGNEWWDDDGWGPSAGREGEPDALLAMEELESALLEAGYAASAVPVVTQNTENEVEIIAIDDDDDDDDTEESDSLDLPVLPCFYVYSQNESHPSRGSRAVSSLEHTQRLQEQEGRDRDETWEGEEYEHDRSISADRTYLKFKKRLDCYPEQCFRYCFNGKPLWANKDTSDPGVCPECGGPRVYEMQLMPPLLYYLQQACKDLPSTSYSPNDWEWLTIVVFSCAQSCTPRTNPYGENKPWAIVEEATILQYEN